jgi:hypothetical protein
MVITIYIFSKNPEKLRSYHIKCVGYVKVGVSIDLYGKWAHQDHNLQSQLTFISISMNIGRGS